MHGPRKRKSRPKQTSRGAAREQQQTVAPSGARADSVWMERTQKKQNAKASDVKRNKELGCTPWGWLGTRSLEQVEHQESKTPRALREMSRPAQRTAPPHNHHHHPQLPPACAPHAPGTTGHRPTSPFPIGRCPTHPTLRVGRHVETRQNRNLGEEAFLQPRRIHPTCACPDTLPGVPLARTTSPPRRAHGVGRPWGHGATSPPPWSVVLVGVVPPPSLPPPRFKPRASNQSGHTHTPHPRPTPQTLSTRHPTHPPPPRHTHTGARPHARGRSACPFLPRRPLVFDPHTQATNTAWREDDTSIE